jgi:hypothetical protein
MNVIIETNWINKPLWKGIREHYQSVNQACGSIEGAEFIGLYRPLNDAWNWTHFMKVDTLEKWREIDREIHRLYPDIDDDVSYSMSRFYWGMDTGRQPPPIRDPDSMKYLVMDLNMSKEANLGIMEYYAQRCEQFAGLVGAGLLGLYSPMTESWNAAIIKLFDSLTRYMEVGIEYKKTYSRIPEITGGVERVYERYEP